MNVDFGDLEALRKLMDRADDFPTFLTGKNSYGEFIVISILDSKIVSKTYQDNDWVRINHYHRDGSTEELWER